MFSVKKVVEKKTFGKRFGFAVCAALFCVVILGCQERGFQTTDGTDVNINDFKGKWIILNYWAIWCHPCRIEIPEFNQLHQQINPKEIMLFAVNFDGALGDKLIKDAASLGINFPQLTTDPSKELGFDRPNLLPATYIIDPAGKLKTVLFGPQTQETILKQLQ